MTYTQDNHLLCLSLTQLLTEIAVIGLEVLVAQWIMIRLHYLSVVSVTFTAFQCLLRFIFTLRST